MSLKIVVCRVDVETIPMVTKARMHYPLMQFGCFA